MQHLTRDQKQVKSKNLGRSCLMLLSNWIIIKSLIVNRIHREEFSKRNQK